MGRESRARRAGPIEYRGDLDRIGVASLTLLGCLRTDARIHAAHATWVSGRNLSRLAWPLRSPGLNRPAVQALSEALMRPASEAEIAAVLQVLDQMGPGRIWPRLWTAQALTRPRGIFATAFYNAIQQPGNQQTLVFTIGNQWGLPRGNRPRAIGQAKVREAVETWYDAYLRDPPIPKPELTRRWATKENRVTDAHSVVDDRLELADSLLNRLIPD